MKSVVQKKRKENLFSFFCTTMISLQMNIHNRFISKKKFICVRCMMYNVFCRALNIIIHIFDVVFSRGRGGCIPHSHLLHSLSGISFCRKHLIRPTFPISFLIYVLHIIFGLTLLFCSSNLNSNAFVKNHHLLFSRHVHTILLR